MLPEPYRLRRHSDFSVAVRRGRRMGRRDLVVHAFDREQVEALVVTNHGPRFGLIVSKAVGPAVIRHRVARRLRHICADLAQQVSPATDVVIRALPGSATASSAELATQLRAGLKKMNLLVSVSEEP
ncbi:ribonuclease P protein component [Rhodococcus sp. SRB_17]|uniref:ribonuclease P protein component n=1 Tax=unclassified Rhodococcus (in: high G+C Gram-positive bacteria) TaxID=192944 RepID=UPI000B93C817|nr:MULTISPECIES: ribonuclease P protein component [unclassified Rhodococcus (in: high G+C Gram-positive bacteria)]MDI9918888.1 ribonuclease P protein component [Rhodococcus sp. IEGM 1379]NMM88671.1 ribonuclease P protein component [Rhodococcus sp. SRB_17]OYD67399.1 ribonuclease P protein component [Rhodococcus sp. OK302]